MNMYISQYSNMLFWSLLASVVNASDIPMTLYTNESFVFKSIEEIKTDEDKIHFLFYHRNNPKKYHEMTINNLESLKQSNYNFNVTTKVIIHGWISSNETTKAIETLKDALVNNSTFNIIVVDWNKLADGLYKTAHRFSTTVASRLIEFLKFLIANGGSPKKIHLIGHSIGAHIAGIVGKYFREQNTKIDAITGLDPTYPNYKFVSEDERLDNEDARYVEVIHTNIGFWGYRDICGHIDFFPNGGKYQPGCLHDKRELCAHDRALLFYAYSVIGTKFVAISIDFRDRVVYSSKKKVVMGGFKLHYGKRGSFWLRTGHSPPFVFKPDDVADDDIK